MEKVQRLLLSIKKRINILQNVIDSLVDDEKSAALHILDLKQEITSNEDSLKKLMENIAWLSNKIDHRELKTPCDHKTFDDICQIIKVYKVTKES